MIPSPPPEVLKLPVVKGQIAEELPSGAKAQRLFYATYGTTKVVPFQSPTFPTGCRVPLASHLDLGFMQTSRRVTSYIEKDLREARSSFGIEVLRPGEVLRRLKP